MMLRPRASSARAFTNTSKADSTPMRLIRSARCILFCFPEEWDAAAVFDFLDTVADGHAVPFDSAGDTASAFQRDDCRLVWRFFEKCLRRRIDDGFGIDCSRPHRAPRMATTQVAPEPP